MALTIAACLLAPTAHAGETGDVDAVRHLLISTFDKPDAPLTVEPVTVAADTAVAGWVQGEVGGRALLRKKNGAWTLVLCSGDALKDVTALSEFGFTAEQARSLAASIAAAEAKLDPTLVAKFSTFDGVVMMDGNGGHPTESQEDGEHKN